MDAWETSLGGAVGGTIDGKRGPVACVGRVVTIDGDKALQPRNTKVAEKGVCRAHNGGCRNPHPQEEPGRLRSREYKRL